MWAPCSQDLYILDHASNKKPISHSYSQKQNCKERIDWPGGIKCPTHANVAEGQDHLEMATPTIIMLDV